MKKALLFGTFAAILMGGTLPALADMHSGYADKIFEEKDTNSDGVISKTEFLEHSEKRFSQMDIDGNGEVVQEELDILKEELGGGKSSALRGKLFAKVDTNSDGAISEEEFLEYSEKKFAKMDGDGDGEITKEEAENHRAEIRKKLERLKKFRERRGQ